MTLPVPPERMPRIRTTISDLRFKDIRGIQRSIAELGQKRLPAGTRIEAVADYDNSAFNPFNPDPTRTVPYGLISYD